MADQIVFDRLLIVLARADAFGVIAKVRFELVAPIDAGVAHPSAQKSTP
jgi:hypothetical protein